MLSTRALAPTTFTASPDDTLATPDVYDIASDSVINNLPSPAALVSTSDLTNELTGGKAMTANLPSLTSLTSNTGASALTSQIIINGQVAHTSDGSLLSTVQQYASTMYKAVGGVAGIKALSTLSGPSLLSRISSGTLSGVPGLSGTSAASALSALRNNAMPTEVKQLFNTPIPSALGSYGAVGSNLTKLVPANINQTYQVGSLINNVMGTTSTNVVDKDASARLIAGLSVAGMSSGMPNSYSTVSTLAQGDSQILAASAQAAMRYASSTGNTAAMKDVTTTLGPSGISALTSMGTSLSKSISTGYTPSTTAPLSSASRLSDYTDLSNTLTSVQPGWNSFDQYTYDPVTGQSAFDYPVTDISLLQEGSPDFKQTMVTGAVASTGTDNWMCAAAMFPTTTPEAELQTNFPMTTTSVTSTTATQTLTIPPNGVYGSWEDDLAVTGYVTPSNPLV